MLLSYDLLYCLPWKSNFIEVSKTKHITICVSDIIYGNEEKTLAQVHLGIFCKNDLANIEDIRGGIVANNSATRFLEHLENQIRTEIWKIISWDQVHPDRQAIKVWYYNKPENPTSTPASCLRMAITMNGIKPLVPKQELEVKRSLEECLSSWIHFLQKADKHK